MIITHTVTPPQAGRRLDVVCREQVPMYSRGALQAAIKAGHITVNSQTHKPSYLVSPSDRLVLNLPAAPAPAPEALPATSLPILYEDRDIVVIDKPPGVAVHGAPNSRAPTVTAWLRARYPNIQPVGDAARPGIVHRLDQDTSGVLVAAKTSAALEHLQQQFARRRVKKTYFALVYGVPTMAKGRLTRPLARSHRNPMRRAVDPSGQPAITEWQREKVFGKRYALLKVFPLTGRTHQIRVHLHFLGYPVVGDSLYAFKRQKPPPGVTRQLMHAAELTLTLPSGRRQTFTAPLPPDFTAVLNQLSARDNNSQ
ncbi:MAG: RluA family pseudouridine synthase [Candidatus Andersenbacteria bacterium]|nr:RluA family pseudouridine synthase [Candidatus Andersenbacteria bacterium]